MPAQISEKKTYKMKTEPSPEVQLNFNQVEQPYVNPIVKNTFQSLPKIYGSNLHRKKKYNISMKSKFELKDIIPKPKESLSNHKHECWHTKQIQIEQSNLRGHSCLEFANLNQTKTNNRQYNRQQITKTILKKRKNLRIETQPDRLNLQELTKTGFQSVTNKKPIGFEQKKPGSLQYKKPVSLESMHLLSKPRQKCNKQYCSCKSLYDEYQQQINKKIREKKKQKSRERSQVNSSRNSNNSLINLPRLSVDIRNSGPGRLEDRQSKHKVNFKYKLNSLQEEAGIAENCCYLCDKSKQLNQSLQSKGLLGLIRKKQIQQKLQRQKMIAHRSSTHTVGIQIDDHLGYNINEDYGSQANLVTPKNKIKTVDQQINTDIQQENTAFKYLQKNKIHKQESLNASQISHKANKKQPLEHLSHLKQKYKYNKRPVYEPKYCIHETEEQRQCCHGSGSNRNRDDNGKSNNQGSKRTRKSNPPEDNEQEFQINESSQSFLSENSLANHLANALQNTGADRSTIFKYLRKRQQQQSEKQQTDKLSKKNKKNKSQQAKSSVKMLNQQKGLFTIPEQDQYIDYLKNYQPIQKDFNLKSLIKSDNFRILRYNDALYFGQTENNEVKHGKALFISPKQIFQGIYQNGIRMSGCERNIDGVYIGQFLNGKRHGQGKFIWNNGQVFEGEYKLGTKNGFGVWKNPKGDYYQGEWLLNRQQGKGIFKHKNSTYEGQFYQFYKHGQGRQTFINGDQYIGSYVNGKPHGAGKYIWKNGSFYEGNFQKGLRQGPGKWHQNDDLFYEGEFKKDFKHGKGKQTYKNGDCYEGKFVEGIRTKGIFKEQSSGKQTQINDDRAPRKLQSQMLKKDKSNIKNELRIVTQSNSVNQN